MRKKRYTPPLKALETETWELNNINNLTFSHSMSVKLTIPPSLGSDDDEEDDNNDNDDNI